MLRETLVRLMDVVQSNVELERDEMIFVLERLQGPYSQEIKGLCRSILQKNDELQGLS